MSEVDLIHRRNRGLLWVSTKVREIYLQEQESCLLLYFAVHEEMMKYLRTMMEKGYIVC